MNWIRLLWADSFRTILSITCMSKLKKPLIICLWLAFWQITAVLVHNSIMLVGPFEALRALWALLPSADFWRSVTGSFGRIRYGLSGGVYGRSTAWKSGVHGPLLEETLEPLMLFLKAVPVASFVILALIWGGFPQSLRGDLLSGGTAGGLCQYHGRVKKYGQKAFGDGRGISDAIVEKNPLYLSSGAGAASGKRMPHCLG